MASTNPATTPGPNENPERAYETDYTAVVFYDGACVLDERYPTAAERRDDVVETLLANHDEVPAEEVAEILTSFGGASADEALGEVIALYADFSVDAHLGETQRDAGPAVLYSAFTDYGDGTTFVEHYGSGQERLAQLRLRAAHLADGYPAGFFDEADEATCKRLIEQSLVSTNGRLYLFDARRADVGGTYATYTSEAS